MPETEPRWRTWGPSYFASIFTIAHAVISVYASAMGLARIVQATNILDASIQQSTRAQEQAAKRLEDQTQTLVKWTKLLFGVTVILVVVTIVLLVATIWPRR